MLARLRWHFAFRHALTGFHEHCGAGPFVAGDKRIRHGRRQDSILNWPPCGRGAILGAPDQAGGRSCMRNGTPPADGAAKKVMRWAWQAKMMPGRITESVLRLRDLE